MGVKIKFATGQIVEFDSVPTDQEIEEVAATFSPKKSTSLYGKAQKFGVQVGSRMLGVPVDTQEEAYSEIVSPVLSGISTAAFGLPKAAIEKYSPELKEKIFPPQTTTRGKVFRGATEAMGFIGGGAGKVATKVGSKVVGKTLGKKLLRGAATGAAFGGSQVTGIQDTPIEQIKTQTGQAATGAILGTAISGLASAAKGMSNLTKQFKNLGEKRGAKYLNVIRKKFYQTKARAVRSFGKEVNKLAEANPGKTVSLEEMTGNILNNVDDMNPETLSAMKKAPILKDIVSGIQKGGDFSKIKTKYNLKEVQEAINYLKTKVPRNIKANNLELMEAIDDLTASQLEAFPEMKAVRTAYAKVAEPFRNIKPQLKFNALEQAMKTGFGGAEGRAAVKQLFPEKMITELGGYKNAHRTVELLYKWGWTIPTFYLGRKIAKGVVGDSGGYNQQ